MAEALGFVTGEVEESDFEPYTDKGLKTVLLKGHTDQTSGPTFVIKDIQTRRTTSKPNPPFTTASLQQTASSALGFAPSRTRSRSRTWIVMSASSVRPSPSCTETVSSWLTAVS